ncbi:MAG: zinc ribbon domain-containing protein [Eubacteriaceae bacterium]|nr:zinc ribbon domain-containing protein [Eubacteriaceae bacterium]
MAFLDGLARRIAQQGKNTIDFSIATADLKNAEYALRRAYRDLGEKYLKSLEGDVADAELAAYVLKAKQAATEIEIIKDKMSALKVHGVCRECGAKLSTDMKYCSDCGTKVADVYSGTSSREAICPICSKPVNSELMFCTYCNTNISDIRAEDEDEYESEPVQINVCPYCHKLAPLGSTECPECGESFD